jgi:hypothetical protein
MKKPGKATIRNIVRIISEKAMLPAMAILFARFIQAYMAVCLWYCEIPNLHLFNDAYAPKRVGNRSVHHRKFALFTCGTRHGLIT